MWDCMLVGDASCVPFFLATVIIGNLVVCCIQLLCFYTWSRIAILEDFLQQILLIADNALKHITFYSTGPQSILGPVAQQFRCIESLFTPSRRRDKQAY